jgi:hypothetical protein
MVGNWCTDLRVTQMTRGRYGSNEVTWVECLAREES